MGLRLRRKSNNREVRPGGLRQKAPNPPYNIQNAPTNPLSATLGFSLFRLKFTD